MTRCPSWSWSVQLPHGHGQLVHVAVACFSSSGALNCCGTWSWRGKVEHVQIMIKRACGCAVHDGGCVRRTIRICGKCTCCTRVQDNTGTLRMHRLSHPSNSKFPICYFLAIVLYDFMFVYLIFWIGIQTCIKSTTIIHEGEGYNHMASILSRKYFWQLSGWYNYFQ